MKQKNSENFEVLDHPIEEMIVNSLKNNYRDYTFNEENTQLVIQLCKKNKVNIIYKYYYDKYGNIDYIEFIPVKFTRTPLKHNSNLQVNDSIIQMERTNWYWKDLSKGYKRKRKSKL